ncbi:UPF0669 protein C6orf120 homolog [Anthonomus grandis grandis]|uniref:UPF0669 protein C6orf120 homolog n=1 Tax=Anthonomus grandis grandis TaxID=2921223 RepID=UPI002165F409|nr:UPF0669 protein C6orf120 homolog [Anthonomus grandis grandis]
MANIIVILIFVIITILFYKMINWEVPVKPKLLGRAGGTLDRDTFSYIYIRSHGPIVLNLTSLFGDTDMYISYANIHPTFEPETYFQHSATCGEDVIELPESSNTPLAIGLYGYGEENSFLLEIYENLKFPSVYKPWIILEQEIITNNKKASDENTAEDSYPPSDNNNKKMLKKKKQPKNASNLSSLFSILEIFELIFL